MATHCIKILTNSRKTFVPSATNILLLFFQYLFTIVEPPVQKKLFFFVSEIGSSRNCSFDEPGTNWVPSVEKMQTENLPKMRREREEKDKAEKFQSLSNQSICTLVDENSSFH